MHCRCSVGSADEMGLLTSKADPSRPQAQPAVPCAPSVLWRPRSCWFHCTRPVVIPCLLGLPDKPQPPGPAPGLPRCLAASCQTPELMTEYPQLALGSFLLHSHYGLGMGYRLPEGRPCPVQGPLGLGSPPGSAHSSRSLAWLPEEPGGRVRRTQVPAAASFIATRIPWSCRRGGAEGHRSLMPYSQLRTQSQRPSWLCPTSSLTLRPPAGR